MSQLTPCAFTGTPAHCVSGVASPGKQHHQLPKPETWAGSELFLCPQAHSVTKPCHVDLTHTSCIHPLPPAPCLASAYLSCFISPLPSDPEPCSVPPMYSSLPFQDCAHAVPSAWNTLTHWLTELLTIPLGLNLDITVFRNLSGPPHSFLYPLV